MSPEKEPPKNLMEVGLAVEAAHKKFIAKFGERASFLLSADLWRHEKTRACLVHVARGMIEQKVMQEVVVQDIYFRGYYCPESIVLKPAWPAPDIVFVNRGTSVEVSSGVMTSSNGVLFLGGLEGSGEVAPLVFEDVLESEFDWKDFALKVLDYIHQIVFRRKEAVNTMI